MYLFHVLSKISLVNCTLYYNNNNFKSILSLQTMKLIKMIVLLTHAIQRVKNKTTYQFELYRIFELYNIIQRSRCTSMIIVYAFIRKKQNR